MGVTEYPCPKCGTPQKVRAPNGVEIKPSLCAACAEKERADQLDRSHETQKEREAAFELDESEAPQEAKKVRR